MRWFWIVLIGFCLLVFEVGALPSLREIGGGPDVVLLFVVFLALYGPVEDAPISGWLLGLGKDSLSTGTFGLYAVLFMALGFFLSRIRSDIFTETNKAHMVNVGTAALLVYTAAALWHWIHGAPFVSSVATAGAAALWSAAMAPAAFHVFFKFSRRLGASRRAG